MNGIRYAIASYKRIDTLKEKTISLLERYKVPPETIYIFTIPEEFTSYQVAFPQCNVIKGRHRLCAQRNYITNFFEEGTPLVCLDDDIEDLKELKNDKLVPVEDLELLVEGAFLFCQAHNLSMWGTYPISNAFFMKPGYSTNLKFCIGHFFGVINRKDIQVTLNFKEDYERTLRYFQRDDGIIRLNYICAKTKMYAPGGIGLKQKERLENNIKSSEYLIKEYPNLVIKNKKKEGEVLLRDLKNKNHKKIKKDNAT